MARWSNYLTMFINICSLIVAITAITLAMTTKATPFSSCNKIIALPSVRLGAFLVVVSLLGLFGSCCRSPFVLWLYLVLYVVVIIVMIIGIVLWVFVVITEKRIDLDSGQVHKMSGFASWFKDHVFGMIDWNYFKQCMVDYKICSMDSTTKYRYINIQQLQDGCCYPPKQCTYNWNNASIPECTAWSNEKDKLCYDCGHCVGRVLQQLSQMWQREFAGYVVLFVVVLVIFSLGCRAFQQHKADHYRKVCYTAKA